MVGGSTAPVCIATRSQTHTQAELEKVAKEKEAKDLANLKPVFLTKKQRQAAALKRLEEERSAKRKEQEEIIQKHRDFEKEARSSGRGDYGSSRAPYSRGRDTQESREQRRAEREKRHAGGSQSTMKDKELQQLKDTYLGKKKEKKKVIPPSMKFKFNFDWGADEDTARNDLDDLYKNRHNASLLFGRGFVAGVDRLQQRKTNSFYEDMLKNKGEEDTVQNLIDPKIIAERERRALEKKAEAKLLTRHWKEKALDEMNERDWRIFKEDFSISTRGANVPEPMRYWHEEKRLSKQLLETLDKIGYTSPTPIQRAAVPVGLSNIDVVGIAETGSGKTCAFLLPMLMYISTLPKLTPKTAIDGPYALIMAPTRELAQQIAEEADKFSADMGITSVSIVGGVSHEDQSWALRNGAEIIIATPGRLYDCIERRYLVLNQCNYICLDEADRMIDLNFEPQILKIMDMMPSSNIRPEDEDKIDVNKRYRQTIMFSATMPLKVEMLAKKYLRNPIFIAVGERQGAVASTVEQRVMWTTENMKRKLLNEILERDEPPFIVFCNAKKTCDNLMTHINSQGFNSTVIHGGKVQEQRTANLKGFKDGVYDVLVATDVVGRGIDVQGVKQVVNYDLPNNIEKYTHRIGRTGRGGDTGIATSFLTEGDSDIMYDLRNSLLQAGAKVPHELEKHEAAKNKPGAVGARKPRPTIQYAKK